MGPVLKSFMIAIGLDSKGLSKGAKDVERSIGGIKSTVLQAGAALTGAFGAKALTIDFTHNIDQATQLSKALGISAGGLRGWEFAFERAGASADSARGALQSITDIRDALAKGDAGALTELGLAGIDYSVITEATDATDALMRIAEVFPKLTEAQQRNAGKTFGFGPAEINMMRRGNVELAKSVELGKKLRPLTEGHSKSAREFAQSWNDLSYSVGGVADKISEPLVGALGGLMKDMTAFVGKNQAFFDGPMTKGVKVVAENIELVAAAVGALGSLVTLGALVKVGKAIAGIGLSFGPFMPYIAAVIAAGVLLAEVMRELNIETPAIVVPEGPPKDLGEIARSTSMYSNPTAASNAAMDNQRKMLGLASAGDKSLGSYQSAASIQATQAASAKPPVTSTPMNVNFMVDGKVLGQQVLDVVNRENQLTLENVKQTTVR